MRIIKTEGQRKYLTKFFQDISKIILVFTVIAPLVKSEFNNNYSYFIGAWIASLFFITGYLLENTKERK
jgi:hypothetical protein